MLSLGPFTLHEPIDDGGLATVWSAQHAATGMPVAVKVLDRTPDVSVRTRALRDELRAMAVLQHPNIVRVLDHGVVPDGESPWPVGAPWIALEYASGGTLANLREPEEWSVIKTWLAQLLSALAHAHAHGVLHRDVKPSNVLLDEQRRSLLCDFGLASALEPDTQNAQAGGTPRYMAPEQFLDDAAIQGPWTDLYGVGCLAWRLITGAAPFMDKGYDALRGAHVYRHVPELEPWCDVPAGLEEWLGLLLAKDPRARFATAADALHHLHLLGPPTVPAAQEDLGDFLEDAGAITRELVSETTRVPEHPHGDALGSPLPIPPRPDPPPFPPISLREHVPDPLMVATSLPLLPMRPVSLAGREQIQHTLWNALGDVHARRAPRLMILEGTSGTGKSRLAAWLVEHARETGAAGALRAVHNPVSGPHDGLVGMLRRHFRWRDGRAISKLQVERALRRRGEIEPHQWIGMSRLLDSKPVTRSERHQLVLRHLRRLTGQRPYVLVLEDAQWADDALSLCEVLLEENLPVLVVVTTDPEALSRRPVERSFLERLVALEGTTSICIEPLSEHGRHAFAAELPVPDRELALAVIEHGGGMPLFAIHQLADWVASGDLVAGPGGPEVRDGALERLPSGLDDLWIRRVHRLLERRRSSDRDALEVAAALGRVVSYDEWTAACKVLGVTPDDSLVEWLIDAGLARRSRRSDPTWSFALGALRDAVLRSIERAGRAPRVHRACATMLEAQQADVIRIGTHLFHARAWEACITPLVRACRLSYGRGEYDRSSTLVDMLEHAASFAGGDAAIRIEILSLRAVLYHRRGQAGLSEVLARQVLDESDKLGLAELRIRARNMLTTSALAHGDQKGALRWAREGLDLAEQFGDPSALCSACLAVGDVLLRMGREQEARQPLEKAADLGRQVSQPRTTVKALLQMSEIDKGARRFRKALARIEEARSLAERIESHSLLGRCDLTRGEVLRYMGEYASACKAYRSAVHRMEAIGEAGAHAARIGLGLCLVLGGEFESGHFETRAGLDTAVEKGFAGSELFAHCALTVWAAFQPDPETYKATLLGTLERMRELDYVEPDYAEVLESGAVVALQRGLPSRAQRMRDAAADIWLMMEREDRAAPLRMLIAPPPRGMT